MTEQHDRLPPSERSGAADCLVELALAWLQRPLAGLPDAERGRAILDMCLLISQMRHRAPREMDVERRRWLERVTVRVCSQVPGSAGHEGAVQCQLEHRTALQDLAYADWRQRFAPPLVSAGSGPSQGGDGAA